MSDHNHTEGNDLVSYGPDAFLNRHKSAQLPKDNQIDDLLKQLLRDMLENYGVDVDEEYWDAPNPRYIKSISAALATAIREAMPEKIFTKGTLTPDGIPRENWNLGHSQALDQVVEALRGIGLPL